MATMQTRTDGFGLDWLNPLGSWEAAARWNAMAFEWMTRGWQQWFELTTVWPALENPAAAVNELARSVDAIDVPSTFLAETSVSPAQAGTQKARNARSLEALDSRLRGNDGAQAKARKRSERPVAKAASRRPASKRPPRARG